VVERSEFLVTADAKKCPGGPTVKASNSCKIKILFELINQRHIIYKMAGDVITPPLTPLAAPVPARSSAEDAAPWTLKIQLVSFFLI